MTFSTPGDRLALSDEVEEIKRIRVRDVMNPAPITIAQDMSARDAAVAMDRSGCGCLLVMSEKKVIGIITERDLVTRVLTKSGTISDVRVRDVMSSPIIVVSSETNVEEAARIMVQNRVRRLPVVAD